MLESAITVDENQMLRPTEKYGYAIHMTLRLKWQEVEKNDTTGSQELLSWHLMAVKGKCTQSFEASFFP